MTKCCEVCHTVNRDRAQYCRGCAGRFKEPGSAPLRTGMKVPGAPDLMGQAAFAGMPTLSSPAPTLSAKTGIMRADGGRLLSLLFPAGAALLATLVVWQQWAQAAELRSRATRGTAQVQMAKPAAAPAALAAAAPASAARSGEPDPVDASAASPEAVPQESLLALAVEHSARKQQQASQAALGGARILEPEASGAASNSAPRPFVGITESDMGIASDVSVESVASDRPTATRAVAAAGARPARRAAAPSKPYYGPMPVAIQAQGITGPCNRYNPFGEVTCANAPNPRGQTHASSGNLARSTQTR